MEMQQFYYDNKIVKKFIYATIVFGVVGMTVGLLLAFFFIFPNLTDGISWLSSGRLRPLHTNAVIFAFVGNAMFAGIYYSLQRLLKARMFSDLLSNINFWGWQLIIVAAAISSLFAIRLQEYDIQGVELLVPLVFLVIIGTVMIQGLGAKMVGNDDEKLFGLCRCSRCFGTMVVRTQCGSIFPYNAIPRTDVLFCT